MVTHPLAEEAIHFRKATASAHLDQVRKFEKANEKSLSLAEVEPPTSRVMLWSPDGKPLGEASAKAAASPEARSCWLPLGHGAALLGAS